MAGVVFPATKLLGWDIHTDGTIKEEKPVRFLVLLVCLSLCTGANAAEPTMAVKSSDRSVTVQIGPIEVLRYVHSDPEVPHPYFAPVRTMSGLQVSRNHPPVAEQDKTDHPGMHTGLWMSFGDLSGHDYWRLKAKTVHQRFADAPTVQKDVAAWSVINHFLATDSDTAVCEETAQYRVSLQPNGYQLELSLEFRPLIDEIVFCDQEEMGLGIRLNTPLAVDSKQGGRILDSEGRRDGAQVWGQTSAWCDYSGPLSGRWVGMTIFSDPANFRPSWNHARDYGLLVVNPFGKKSFTGGAASRLRVPRGETLRLKYRVLVHESDSEPKSP